MTDQIDDLLKKWHDMSWENTDTTSLPSQRETDLYAAADELIKAIHAENEILKTKVELYQQSDIHLTDE
jgi:hypothetical protein